MRLAILFLFGLMVPNILMAASYHTCSAPLILPTDETALPMSELEFVLTLGNHDPNALAFVAQGEAFDGLTLVPLLWRGSWISDADMLFLVGQADADHMAEWRANSVRQETDVLILILDQGKERPLMVRCLPRDGA